jgi:glutathione peroxidase-family protein
VLKEIDLTKTVHDFKVLDMSKNQVDLSIYNGHVKLIVNVASF